MGDQLGGWCRGTPRQELVRAVDKRQRVPGSRGAQQLLAHEYADTHWRSSVLLVIRWQGRAVDRPRHCTICLRRQVRWRWNRGLHAASAGHRPSLVFNALQSALTGQPHDLRFQGQRCELAIRTSRGFRQKCLLRDDRRQCDPLRGCVGVR